MILDLLYIPPKFQNPKMDCLKLVGAKEAMKNSEIKKLAALK